MRLIGQKACELMLKLIDLTQKLKVDLKLD